MLRTNEGLIISASIVFQKYEAGDWFIPHGLARLLCDKISERKKVLLLLYPPAFGMQMTNGDVGALAGRMNAAINVANYDLSDIELWIVLSMDEPEPIWMWARQFGINLHQTCLVSRTEKGRELAENADIGQFQLAKQFFFGC